LPDDIDIGGRQQVLAELGYEQSEGRLRGLTLFLSRLNSADRLVIDLSRQSVPLRDFTANLERNGVESANISAALEQVFPSE